MSLGVRVNIPYLSLQQFVQILYSVKSAEYQNVSTFPNAYKVSSLI